MDLNLYGNKSLLKKKNLVVVGSRRSSEYGEEVTRDLVERLASKGLVISSGMAKGIDTVAHEAALAGGGNAIGFLGFGFKYLEKVEEVSSLARKLINSKQGLIVSPFKYSQYPTKQTFIERNRLMAKLCDGVLVIEATLNSGTMSTVEFAMEFNKPIFAIPGDVFNYNSKGTHFLIKNGAILVDSEEDILNLLPVS